MVITLYVFLNNIHANLLSTMPFSIAFFISLILFAPGTSHLIASSPYGNLSALEQVLAGVNISSACGDAFTKYLHGMKAGERWALQMRDSSADVAPPGLLKGNLVDLGNFDECIGVSSEDSALEGKYCLITTSVNAGSRTKRFVLSPYLVQETSMKIQLGQCFPSNCTVEDLQTVLGRNVQLRKKYCQTKQPPHFGKAAIATVCFFAVILLLVFLSTLYEVILYYTSREPYHQTLVAFSLLTTTKKLASDGGRRDISCLHGIRVISTMWIILVHIYTNHFNFPITDFFGHSEWIKNEANMFVINGNIAVDTFLFLSGLLVAYSFMGNATKGHKFNVILHYVHRYFRITPVLAVVALFYATLLVHVGSGPLWPALEVSLVEGCRLNWWKALLHVQNINGGSEPLCVDPAWYLSVDMQLFLLSPLLLLPLAKYPKLGLSVLCSLSAASMGACFGLGWFLELPALNQAAFSIERITDYTWHYYFPTYTRAAPWMIGMVFGYVLHRLKEETMKFSVNKLTATVGWMVSLTILCTCLFSGHNLAVGPYDRIANSFHLALVRPAWTLGVAWVVLACERGYGGPVNQFLSANLFQVLSKLTYSVYLVHYPIIFIIIGQMRSTESFSNAQAMYHFWGDLACALVVAFLVTVAVEFPVATLERSIFGP